MSLHVCADVREIRVEWGRGQAWATKGPARQACTLRGGTEETLAAGVHRERLEGECRHSKALALLLFLDTKQGPQKLGEFSENLCRM